jgi:hypothetical protein
MFLRPLAAFFKGAVLYGTGVWPFLSTFCSHTVRPSTSPLCICAHLRSNVSTIFPCRGLGRRSFRIVEKQGEDCWMSVCHDQPSFLVEALGGGPSVLRRSKVKIAECLYVMINHPPYRVLSVVHPCYIELSRCTHLAFCGARILCHPPCCCWWSLRWTHRLSA